LTAETAEKKTRRILGVLCVLSGKTPHFFTRSGLRHSRLVKFGPPAADPKRSTLH